MLDRDNHPEHPGCTVASFFDVELSQTDGANRLTEVTNCYPGDRKVVTASLSRGNLHPPIETIWLRWMTPLSPAEFTNGWDKVRIIGQ
jgi:hypothetical protein